MMARTWSRLLHSHRVWGYCISTGHHRFPRDWRACYLVLITESKARQESVSVTDITCVTSYLYRQYDTDTHRGRQLPHGAYAYGLQNNIFQVLGHYHRREWSQVATLRPGTTADKKRTSLGTVFFLLRFVIFDGKECNNQHATISSDVPYYYAYGTPVEPAQLCSALTCNPHSTMETPQ